MIEITIRLHSAKTGEVTELGRMVICNDGTGDENRGNYNVYLGRKGANISRTRDAPARTGRVEDHARKHLSVWVLANKAIESLGLRGATYHGSKE